jgi:hypothetical protein
VKAQRAALITGLGLMVVAFGEDAAVQPVNVGGIVVLPAGNPLSAFDDLLVVHPKVLVGVTYDSNVQGTSPAEGDELLRLVAGATAHLRLDEQSDALADAELEDLRYHTNDSLDLIGGKASVAINERGTVAQFTAQAGLDREETRQFETGAMVKTQTDQASSSATYKAIYTNYGLDLAASRMQYLEDTPIFSADQGSHDDYALGLHAGWDYARDANIFVHLVTSSTQYDSDSLYDNSYGAGLRLGWGGAVGDRSRLSAEAGVDYRHYLGTEGKQAPYNQENAYGPAFALTLSWPWAERSRLDATATSTVADGVTSDAAWTMDFGVKLQQELGRAMSFSFSTDINQVRNLSATTGEAREVRTSFTVGCGLDVRHPSGIVLHLGGQYLDSHSTTANSYQDFQLISDLAYAY